METHIKEQHCQIFAHPKYLKDIFPLISKVMMLPERARHCLPNLGRTGCLITRCSSQALGSSSISCKCCLLCTQGSHRIAIGRPKNHTNKKALKRFNIRNIKDSRSTYVPVYQALALMLSFLLRGSKLIGSWLTHH
ncbi:unnamed protein product [Pipistrellus nathusii]|uniref:Uncharacterized protein n=1 Tax=Pipistrellus nathusii TaxID=59473 RepID=A0ABN9ZXJ8_PIPNA